jgi:hypothetical protein
MGLGAQADIKETPRRSRSTAKTSLFFAMYHLPVIITEDGISS